ncbi:glycosyltransferase [Bradyrhizobium elkanii]|uniref:glycosyltransferase n=1 Tax=Bradyrhizobium elkanii TaxID=29448 RepID=UPI0004B4B4A3|nr:glycosyltransferase [Bradyrhizobium elkanii]WLA85829.1 glycosyltransferase [Bradyrhizobium elkanii]
MQGKKLAGHLLKMRPHIRRLLPGQLHHWAGHTGRWLIRNLEARRANAAIGLPAMLPSRDVDRKQAPIVIVGDALSAGGAERQMVNLALGLSARNHRVLLLTLRLDERPDLRFFLKDVQSAANLEIRDAMTQANAEHYLAQARGAAGLAAFRGSLNWAPADVRSDILRLAAELHQIGPSVVHGFQDATGLCSAFAALAVGASRIVVSGRNVHPEHFSNARPYMQAAYRLLAEHASVTLVNNSDAGAQSYAEWLDLRWDKIRVVRNGIAPGSVSSRSAHEIATFRQNLGIRSGDRLIGGVFRFQAEKRPLLWIEVAAGVAKRIPNARFVIFGEGTLRPQMKRLVAHKGLGDRILMPGNTSESDIAIAAFDVLLLTSLYEGTPNVLLEATCLGVPVVATDAGGTPEAMIDGQAGLLVHEGVVGKARVVEALTDATINVLEGSVSRNNIKGFGPRFVMSRFGLERMIEETLTIYELS